MDSRSLADRWLCPEMARFASCVVLAMVASLVVCLFATNRRGETALGSPLGADFGQFYVAGMILNEGHRERLYDLDYQDQRLHQLVPSMAAGEHLPFAYPPFLASMFRPLARLPFAWSFASWLALTAGMYAVSVGLVLGRGSPLNPADRQVAWLLAFSFSPFAIECGLGGQLSSLGCLAVATGLALLRGPDKTGSGTLDSGVPDPVLSGPGRPGAAGLAFSILLYKPTLLLLIVPMLVVGRCWRVLAGFGAGAAILAWISLLVVGLPGCLDFLGLMVGYGRLGGSVGQGFKTMKYVDLTAFLRLLGVGLEVARPLAIAMGTVPLIALILAWARTARGRPSDLAWTATLCWTPILNVYGPIYDVTLAVPGILLAAREIRRRSPGEWPSTFRWLLAFLYLAALITQPSALKLGFQPLTIALAAIGTYFLRVDRRGIDGAQAARMGLFPRHGGLLASRPRLDSTSHRLGRLLSSLVYSPGSAGLGPSQAMEGGRASLRRRADGSPRTNDDHRAETSSDPGHDPPCPGTDRGAWIHPPPEPGGRPDDHRGHRR